MSQNRFMPDNLSAGGIPQMQAVKERKGCSCKNSQCLKLYCECFTRGEYCGLHCHCSNCKNNSENEQKRAETISNILERNPEAFRAKITTQPNKNTLQPQNQGLSNSGQKYKQQNSNQHLNNTGKHSTVQYQNS